MTTTTERQFRCVNPDCRLHGTPFSESELAQRQQPDPAVNYNEWLRDMECRGCGYDLEEVE
jgi:hypothetical protein